MYCKIFPVKQAYGGMSDMNIACDEVAQANGWFCLYNDERLVACFDMTTINGLVMIDSPAVFPDTECETCTHVDCGKCEKRYSKVAQTDCAWMKPEEL